MGYYLRLIVLNVQKWRDGLWTDTHILATILEEFCQHYWGIDDEEVIKIKVLEIMNKILHHSITFDELYGSSWKLAYPELIEVD